ncbi:MAG: 3'-5' exonuclease [Epsilonproteobacteria bacterium]|nr:3'-5' exonuclease [Campylobacterota bacterium]
MICIFDCETIPDPDLLRASFAVEGSDEEVTKRALELYEKESGTTFLPLPFHKIVAISAVIADDFGRFDRVSTIRGENEEEMIGEFLRFIDRHNPRLVTFNGRSFDVPLLLLRALRYNLTCPAYFEQENQQYNKSRWDNYRTRFSETFHLDLLDSLSHYGAVRGMRLDHICQMAGLPGKFDISGGDVVELYYKDELSRIKEYCESDALNTYLLFLKYELLKGNIVLEEYRSILADMIPKLPKDRSYSQVFLEFLQKESDGRPRA